MDIDSPDSVIDQENNNKICENQENKTISSAHSDENEDVVNSQLQQKQKELSTV
ncbi:19625_t:CDS:1, partial [Dentiscutata erythropus]